MYLAFRQALGPDFPMMVRVSASDFDAGSLTPGEVAKMLRPLLEYGLDAVDVSAGGLLPAISAGIGPEFQVPLARHIRAALDVPTIAVGLIRDAANAERILQEGKADFIAIG